jgi:hypothetical protein
MNYAVKLEGNIVNSHHGRMCELVNSEKAQNIDIRTVVTEYDLANIKKTQLYAGHYRNQAKNFIIFTRKDLEQLVKNDAALVEIFIPSIKKENKIQIAIHYSSFDYDFNASNLNLSEYVKSIPI